MEKGQSEVKNLDTKVEEQKISSKSEVSQEIQKNETARRQWRDRDTSLELHGEVKSKNEPENEERKSGRKIVRIKRQIEGTNPNLVQTDKEDESTVAEPEDKVGAFKMVGKLPPFKAAFPDPPVKKISFEKQMPGAKDEAEETKKADKEEKVAEDANKLPQFNFKFGASEGPMKFQTEPSAQQLMEVERRRKISTNLFDKTEEDYKKQGKQNPFLVKPVKDISKLPKVNLVDENPLDSAGAIKMAKEAKEDPEDQPKPFSLFALQGNSKAREAAKTFKPFKPLPKVQSGSPKIKMSISFQSQKSEKSEQVPPSERTTEKPQAKSDEEEKKDPVSLIKPVKSIFDFQWKPRPEDVKKPDQSAVSNPFKKVVDQIGDKNKIDFAITGLKQADKTPESAKSEEKSQESDDEKQQESSPTKLISTNKSDKIFQKQISSLKLIKLVKRTVGISFLSLEKKESSSQIHIVCRGLNGTAYFNGFILSKTRVRDMKSDDLLIDQDDDDASKPIQEGVKISVFVHSKAKGLQEEHCLIEFQNTDEKESFKQVVKASVDELCAKEKEAQSAAPQKDD